MPSDEDGPLESEAVTTRAPSWAAFSDGVSLGHVAAAAHRYGFAMDAVLHGSASPGEVHAAS